MNTENVINSINVIKVPLDVNGNVYDQGDIRT